MAANPHPTHITAEMWWFVEELERLDPADTVFAGAWGNFKPGYHCDYHTLLATPAWRNDYSVHLADDKVGGTWLQNYGAAVDWTSLSAQAGHYEKFKKYGQRVRAAWQAKDLRLKGWREVLCQGDSDPLADGYDFVYWSERTPDLSHTWHMHFSCLRKFLATKSVYQAMISILKGETLAEWQREGDVMAQVFQWKGKYWISKGDAKERAIVSGAVGKMSPEMNVVTSAHKVYPEKDSLGYPVPDLTTRDWTEALVDLAFGKVAGTP